jgi:hypothetical protein
MSRKATVLTVDAGVHALVAIVAVASGATLAASHPSVNAALVCAIGLVCTAPLLARMVRPRLDIFEPLVIASITLFVMFALHPAVLISRLDLPYKGYDIGPEIRGTLVTVLTAVAAFQLGYALPFGRNIAMRLTAPGVQWRLGAAVTYANSLALLGAVLFGAFIAKSGGTGFLLQLMKGRTGQDDSYFRASTAYFYGAPQLFVPASLLMLAAGVATQRKRLVVLAFVTILPLAVFAGSRGERSVLAPLLLAPVVYWYLAHNRRPRALALVIATYLTLTVGLAFFRDSRVVMPTQNRPAELVHSLRNPAYEIHALVVDGVDVDMFESIAVERMLVERGMLHPSPIGFAERILAKPVPSVLWKHKPKEPDEYVNKKAFPGETVRASNSTGPIGTFYYGGGLPGVILGMTIVGVLLRIPWEYWQLHRDTDLGRIGLTIAIAFTPVLLRAGVADAVARSLFIIVPILVAPRFFRRGVRSYRPAEAHST